MIAPSAMKVEIAWCARPFGIMVPKKFYCDYLMLYKN